MGEFPRAMKLVHVTTVPMSLGFVAGQAAYMRAKGIDTHAISSPGDSLWEFSEREGVPAHSAEMLRRIAPFRDLRAIVRMWRVLRRIRPGIVHAHTPKGGLLGMIAAWLAWVPVRIYHMHGLPLATAVGYKRTLLYWSERFSCRLAHRVLCVSRSVRDVAVQQGLCPPTKIEVLLNGSVNGVDGLGRFDPARVGASARAAARAKHGIPLDATVLGFVGRLVADKGLSELAAAWKGLREQFPKLHLLVVGPFESHDPIPRDVRDLLLCDPRIHLAGEDWHTPPLYAAMDVVALPSYREGLPTVCLEAAAMELPVVATRIPGCVDAVQDGVTGTLVPPRDAGALEEAIRTYLNDPALRHEHGRAGRERALRDFGQEAIWQAVYQQYVHLLARRRLVDMDGASAGGTRARCTSQADALAP
jgi:glycosyltransferase involved in cell wall biosynthesis